MIQTGFKASSANKLATCRKFVHLELHHNRIWRRLIFSSLILYRLLSTFAQIKEIINLYLTKLVVLWLKKSW